MYKWKFSCCATLTCTDLSINPCSESSLILIFSICSVLMKSLQSLQQNDFSAVHFPKKYFKAIINSASPPTSFISLGSCFEVIFLTYLDAWNKSADNLGKYLILNKLLTWWRSLHYALAILPGIFRDSIVYINHLLHLHILLFWTLELLFEPHFELLHIYMLNPHSHCQKWEDMNYYQC